MFGSALTISEDERCLSQRFPATVNTPSTADTLMPTVRDAVALLPWGNERAPGVGKPESLGQLRALYDAVHSRRFSRYVDYGDFLRVEIKNRLLRGSEARGPSILPESNRNIYTIFNGDRRNTFQELLDDKVNAAVATIEWHAARKADTRITDRAREVVELARQEYPDYEIPKVAALNSMFLLFRPRLNLRMPTITPTDRGGIWAQWRADGRAAAAEFRPDGLVNLAALYPDPRLMRRIASNGQYSWRAALDELRSDRGFRWLSAARHGRRFVAHD